MLFAKVEAPQVTHVELQHATLKRATESRITLFTAPAGYVSGDSLAAALNECGRPTLWLRLGPEDADPATLLLSLIAGAQRLCPDVGATTVEQMRRRPGPTAGWPPLFAQLGQELAEALPASTALVLEHVHHLADAHPTLELLGVHLLPSLPAVTSCILTTHAKIPSSNWPTFTTQRGAGDLYVNARSASALFQRTGGGLPTRIIERAVSLTEGRADALSGLCAAAAELGPALIQQVVERAAGLDDLLFRVACAWLATANSDTLQALALAVRLGYSHPSLIQATLGNVTPPTGPLLQVLGDEWTRVRCVWKTSLRTAVSARGSPSYATLHQLADYLASHDALEQAVPLYYELGDTASAAQVIARAAETLIDRGQWQTLSNWLDQLGRPTPQGTERSDGLKPTSLWSRLLGSLGIVHRPSGPVTAPVWYAPPQLEMPPDITEIAREALPKLAADMGKIPDTKEPPPAVPATAEQLIPTAASYVSRTCKEPSQAQSISPSKATTAPIQTPTLTAHLLGTFRVSVNDRPVENRPGGRGRAMLKYLLIHHDQPTPRDVLMDVFWPDANPEAARNRLHVALHNIRLELRAVTGIPVVIFEDGAYSLNPDFHLWVDVDEFDRHVEKGRRLEAAGQIAKAAAEYEPAISLYQSDLLAEDPYEEWPVLARERLRVAYLDTLDRLSHIYFDRGEYAACVTLCQLVLARDNCREDAHCLLMHCYGRQGQHYLALRQYQACVEALKAELDTGPAPTTTQLYERIRRREYL